METIGLLPCAGLGLRMRPLKYPKELLPIGYYCTPDGRSVRPRLSIEYSFDAFKMAGITNCYVIVPDWKPEIMRYLGDGSEFGLHIAYLHNSKANGLADAIFSMEPWANNTLTALALPDTQFCPQSGFNDLSARLEKEGADLVLGIFPTDEPQHLAPVELDDTGKVLGIEDKPTLPRFRNAWGTALWNSRFWAFFKSIAGELPDNISISDVFQGAVEAGLKVYGKYFDQGFYHDIGRIDHLPFPIERPDKNTIL
jgi:glucose-1-phosphate thymidylyltransferase